MRGGIPLFVVLERADDPLRRNVFTDHGLVVPGLQNVDQNRGAFCVTTMTYPLFVNDTFAGKYERELRSVILACTSHRPARYNVTTSRQLRFPHSHAEISARYAPLIGQSPVMEMPLFVKAPEFSLRRLQSPMEADRLTGRMRRNHLSCRNSSGVPERTGRSSTSWGKRRYGRHDFWRRVYDIYYE